MGSSLRERFEAQYEPEPTSGCFLWTGVITSGGYGKIQFGWQQVGAHQVAYQLYVGPIPPDRVLDHLCRVRSCVNPDHLEVVTRGENVLRGIGTSAQNARKKACWRGHPFSGDHFYIYTKGSKSRRRCRKCESIDYRARIARQQVR